MWRLLLSCLLWMSCLLGPHAAARDALVVDGRSELPLWPAVRLLADPGHALTLAQVLARDSEFSVPTGTPANLGRTASSMWLRMTLEVPGSQARHRVLQIDYPTLNHVDVWLLRDGLVLKQHTLGNLLRVSERPIPARTLAAPLRLEPGRYELVLRVQTTSTMVLPMRLLTPEAFSADESREQLLLGVTIGLALCMLLYSVSHWVSLRDPVFLLYAAMLVGNTVFFMGYFGIGQQYLWPDWTEASARIAPMAILLSVAAGSQFVRMTVLTATLSPRLDRFIRLICVLALLSLLGAAAGLPYPVVQTLATVLGVSLTAGAVPATLVCAMRGELTGRYMLAGWVFYVAGAVSIAALLRGYVEPGFWTQHLFLLSTMVEMAAWMGVLGLRVQAIHRNADRARLESETMRTLAQTDALTGLPNRRGLQERLQPALAACGPQQLLAVYLLDLDGFKPVNDRHGHDVGDALLVAVGQRLQAQLRGSDVVARLGGDEFVVLATGLADEAVARTLGQKMLSAFNEPFVAQGQRCEVGLTIGYALAPLDGTSADDLIKRADAAMYAGKQAGRRQLQRGGRSMVAV